MVLDFSEKTRSGAVSEKKGDEGPLLFCYTRAVSDSEIKDVLRAKKRFAPRQKLRGRTYIHACVHANVLRVAQAIAAHRQTCARRPLKPGAQKDTKTLATKVKSKGLNLYDS